MTKGEMIEEMNERRWMHELTMRNSREEIQEEYDTMIDECAGGGPMNPNGRDYDAEDEDGPCGS